MSTATRNKHQQVILRTTTALWVLLAIFCKPALSTPPAAPSFSFFIPKQSDQDINSIIAKFDQGKFQQRGNNFVNFGRTNVQHWMHFSLSGSSAPQVLEIDNAHIYDIKVYRRDGMESPQLLYHTGSKQVYSKRPYAARNFVFPIRTTATQRSDYFVSLDRRGEVLKLNFRILPERQYLAGQNLEYWFYGGFTGILLFIVLFNIFLRIALHDEVHTWYSGYIVFVLLFVLADTGLGYEFLWGNYPGLNTHVRTFTGMLAFVLQMQFMQLFISQNRENSRFYTLVNWSKRSFILLTLLSLIPVLAHLNFPPTIVSIISSAFSVAYVCGIALVGLSLGEKIYSRNKTGLIYLLAIIPLMIQVLLVMLFRWHLISLPINTSITMAFSVLIELIILTLGLTIRYNYFKTEKNKLEIALAGQQKNAIEKVLNAQEEERRRISGDLHDDLGGTLSSIKVILSGLKLDQGSRPGQLLADSQHLLDKACDDLRFIAHDLMPADFSKTTLSQAIEEMVVKLNSSSEIEFSYSRSGSLRDLDKSLELNLYRILNELIHNIRKHAGATYALIQLNYHDDFLQLMVEDNGRGFDVHNQEINPAGIGLRNIQSRTEYIRGKIYFDSSSQGTTVTCNVPYPNIL